MRVSVKIRFQLEQATAVREEALRKLGVRGLSGNDKKQLVNIRSPVAGKVVEISVAGGEYRNDTSMPVLTIADLRSRLC